MFNHCLAALLSLGRSTFGWIGESFALPLTAAAKAILIVNVCLAGTLAFEIFEGSNAMTPADPIKVPLSPTASTASLGSSSSTVSVSEDLDYIAAKIVSRPLFAPDRRPVHPQVAGASANPVVEPPVKLVGTIVSDRIRVAFLEIADKRITRVVGESVGSSRIVAIDPGLIRLQSGYGQITDVYLSWGARIEPTPRPPPLRSSLLQ